MPIYEYQCTKCGISFEVLQNICDENLTICKKCFGELLKVISPSGFVLKGSGFYVNDHPSESRKKGMEEEKRSFTSESIKPSKGADSNS